MSVHFEMPLFCFFLDIEDPKVLFDIIASGQLEIIQQEQQGVVAPDEPVSVTWSTSVEYF